MGALLTAFQKNPGVYYGAFFRATGINYLTAWWWGGAVILAVGLCAIGYTVGADPKGAAEDDSSIPLAIALTVIAAAAAPIWYFLFMTALPFLAVGGMPYYVGRWWGNRRFVVQQIASKLTTT